MIESYELNRSQGPANQLGLELFSYCSIRRIVLLPSLFSKWLLCVRIITRLILSGHHKML